MCDKFHLSSVREDREEVWSKIHRDVASGATIVGLRPTQHRTRVGRVRLFIAQCRSDDDLWIADDELKKLQASDDKGIAFPCESVWEAHLRYLATRVCAEYVKFCDPGKTPLRAQWALVGEFCVTSTETFF